MVVGVWVPVPAGTRRCAPRPNFAPRPQTLSSRTGGQVQCAVQHEGSSASASRRVLTPARDFWMFSLALAMSRRITLAPFSCRQGTRNQAFVFIKTILIKKERNPSTEAKRELRRVKAQRHGEGRKVLESARV